VLGKKVDRLIALCRALLRDEELASSVAYGRQSLL